MTTDVIQTQRRNGLWREMLEGWVMILTEPSLDTFRAQKNQADPLKTVIGVGLLGLVIGLWALAVSPAFQTGLGSYFRETPSPLYYIHALSMAKCCHGRRVRRESCEDRQRLESRGGARGERADLLHTVLDGEVGGPRGHGHFEFVEPGPSLVAQGQDQLHGLSGIGEPVRVARRTRGASCIEYIEANRLGVATSDPRHVEERR